MKHLIRTLVLMPTILLAPIVGSFFQSRLIVSHRPKYLLIA
jgi:hypothetical protein